MRAHNYVFQNADVMKKVLSGKSLKEAFPTVRRVILMEGSLPAYPALAQNVLTWTELLDLGRAAPDQILADCEKDQAVNQASLMLYTSGTTGPPKGKTKPTVLQV